MAIKDERTHKVHATVKLNPALNNADLMNRAAHSVLATAVAKGDDYRPIPLRIPYHFTYYSN